MNAVREVRELLLYFFLVLFLLTSLFFSQLISPDYAGIVYHKDQKAAVRLLQTMENTPSFSREDFLVYTTRFRKIFGVQSVAQAHQAFVDREQALQKLEDALKDNPSNTALLLNTAALYRAQNQEEKAQEFLERARSIDPAL